MLSLADRGRLRRVRSAAEWTMRAALILSLLVAIRIAISAMTEQPSLSAHGGEVSIDNALRDWSTVQSPKEGKVKFDSTPSPMTREWARSLRGAGTKLSWSTSIPATGISVEPIADPKNQSRISIAAPRGSRVALEDSLGGMDSLSVRAFGASAGPVTLHGQVRMLVGGATATAQRSDSLTLGAVLVIGRAGWEGKFIAASLEEYGWHVAARLSVAPGNDVTLGSPAIDIGSSLYSAVIVLDSSASRYAPAIERYVRGGGGLVAIGEGATARALQTLLPGTTGDLQPAGEVSSARPRNGFAMRSLSSLEPDAVVLEKRGARVAVAARRVDKGRVLQIGYDETWRWRMAGTGDAVEDYRNWISSVVSSVAYAPRIELPVSGITNAAPLASIFESLGSPAPSTDRMGTGESAKLLMAVFLIAIVALVVETASRRLDGKP